LGIAVTFVDWEDLSRWSHIDKELQFGQPDPTETYSSSEHLFQDLNIPSGTKGRIAASKKVAGAKSSSDTPKRPAGKSFPVRSDRPRSDKPRSDKPKTDGHQKHEGKSEHPRPPRNRTRNRTRGGQG
jgi:hypothetical protein